MNAAAPALSHYDQTPARWQSQGQCVPKYPEIVGSVFHRPQHGDGEHSLSSTFQGRTFEHRSAVVNERDLAKQVASALVVDFGKYRSTHKTIAQHAGASPETVKRWIAADSAPSLVYIVRLLPHSPSLRKLMALESELSPDFTRELSALIQRHIGR